MWRFGYGEFEGIGALTPWEDPYWHCLVRFVLGEVLSDMLLNSTHHSWLKGRYLDSWIASPQYRWIESVLNLASPSDSAIDATIRCRRNIATGLRHTIYLVPRMRAWELRNLDSFRVYIYTCVTSPFTPQFYVFNLGLFMRARLNAAQSPSIHASIALSTT